MIARTTVAKLVIVLAGTAMMGCLGGAKLTRRYNRATISGIVATPDLTAPSLSVFVLEAPRETAKVTLRDLSERGQAALIDRIGQLSTSAQDFNRNLGLPVREPVPPQGIIDERRKRRRIVFSVTNNSRNPGNRLHKTNTILDSLVGANFTSWNQFTTEFGTVDLGTMGSEQNRSLSAAMNADPRGPLFGGQSITGTASAKLTEAIALRERYIKISGTLASNSATVYQQGVAGIDLSGNFSVDIDFDLTGTPYAVPSFIVGSSPTGITLSRVQRVFVRPAVAVTATPRLCAEARVIENGARSLMEGDDRAIYHAWPCEDGTGIEILRATPLAAQTTGAASGRPASASAFQSLGMVAATAFTLPTNQPHEAPVDEPQESQANTPDNRPASEPAQKSRTQDAGKQYGRKLTLLSEDEAQVTAWALASPAGNLHVRYTDNEDDPLLFLSHADAERVLLALLDLKVDPKSPVTLAGRELCIPILSGKKVLLGEDVKTLFIVIKPLNWTPPK